jgi:hypothetical protein
LNADEGKGYEVKDVVVVVVVVEVNEERGARDYCMMGQVV